MKKKERLDVLLVERELVETRSKAKACIMAGEVFVNGNRVEKAGTQIKVEASIEVRSRSQKYASRGGLKLEAALNAFDYSCADKIVVDVGASTGGFTDCVLQNGATKVYAIDVGYGQLAWKLQTDERVVSMERTNVRHTTADLIPESCDLAVVDCSFISLNLILPATLRFLRPNSDVITLIKPQFEVGRENIAKGGVVKDMEARQKAIENVISQAESLGLTFLDGIDCPIHGPAGNIEYLAWFKVEGSDPRSEE